MTSQETQIRQASREAAEFSSLQKSAKIGLDEISQISAEAAALKTSIQATADQLAGTLTKVSENAQKVSGVAVQVDQHGSLRFAGAEALELSGSGGTAEAVP